MANDIDFNRVLEIFQQWGPAMRIPVEQRWQREWPGVSEADIQDWKEHCARVAAAAWDLAAQVLNGHLSQSEGRDQLAKTHPELNSDRVKHTFSHAMYSVSK